MPQNEKSLGQFLKNRRARLDPAAFGFPVGRRRTPGLRREEVALRANISPTWYTWLEQGRGGAPSANVLDRIAAGLMLTEAEREHLHILAFGHVPEVRHRPEKAITPRLQRVLDAIVDCPAIILDATWNVHAWNRAAALILTDYGKLRPEQRNVLRILFSRTGHTSNREDWNSVARYVVARFRADAARAGANVDIAKLVEDLSVASPEFKSLWSENEITGRGEGTKRLFHQELGTIEMDFSTFSVEGRSDLKLMIHTPASEEQAGRLRSYLLKKKS
ncbi:helix-turn-helix transcriptional regulator [uncultured Roseibium sp.]|uniref:helix-turn-helix transcriptional regulator n=1 Tax=uncultured Roseibium sp. TaxID=1936171 RepID=UPI002628FDBB|nr:helix-turn-helix transcriptional regulator [uncultured Roseibium sp.]